MMSAKDAPPISGCARFQALNREACELDQLSDNISLWIPPKTCCFGYILCVILTAAQNGDLIAFSGDSLWIPPRTALSVASLFIEFYCRT